MFRQDATLQWPETKIKFFFMLFVTYLLCAYGYVSCKVQFEHTGNNFVQYSEMLKNRAI